MSAVTDNAASGPIQVLFALHEGFDLLDFTGPYEFLYNAQHDNPSNTAKPFELKIAAGSAAVKSDQGVTVRADMDWEDAHADLDDFDILIIPGGSTDPVLEANAEPIGLTKVWADMQRKDPSKERTLLSVCTGSLLLARAGVLQGLAATTHHDHYTKLEMLCQEASIKDLGVRTDVMEERYVVNNARFELGERWDQNPFILDKRPDARRKSMARKGSDAWKMSKRRESIVKRSNMPVGGLRVVTAGGVTAGMDATLYLIAALVSHESAITTAKLANFNWQKGVTVEGIDV